MEEKKVYIEISARHVHLPEDIYKQLFGPEAEMEAVKKLTGFGFVDKRRVTLVGPKGTIERVAVLGPYRPFQVELAATDARKLGVDAPIRLSGNTAGSAAIKVIGDFGEYDAAEGAIIAKRHIHLAGQDAADWNLTDNDSVKVRIVTENRTTVYEDVAIRVVNVIDHGGLMHIDTDEGNAAGLAGPYKGIIVE